MDGENMDGQQSSGTGEGQQNQNQSQVQENPQGNSQGNTAQPIDTKGLLAELMSISQGSNNRGNPAPAPVNANSSTTLQEAPDPVLDPGKYIDYTLRQQIAPLNDFVQQMQRERTYNAIKTRLRINPQTAGVFAQIEPMLDQQILSLPANIPITEQLVVDAFLSTIGRVSLMMAGGNNQNTQNNQPNANNPGTVTPQGSNVSGSPANINNPGNGGGNQRLMTPPHVAPRNPAPALSGNDDYSSQLTEEEKSWGRSKGLTLEEVYKLKTVAPDQVNTVYAEIKARKAKENK